MDAWCNYTSVDMTIENSTNESVPALEETIRMTEESMKASKQAGKNDSEPALAETDCSASHQAIPAAGAEPSVTEPSKRIGFLTLSGELRNMIYEEALVSHNPIDLWPVWSDREEYMNNVVHNNCFTRIFDRFKNDVSFGLLCACRRTNIEGSSIFYSQNSFRFTEQKAWIVLNLWLTTIGRRNRSYVQNISVHAPRDFGDTTERPCNLHIDGRLNLFADKWSLSTHFDTMNRDTPELEDEKTWTGVAEKLFFDDVCSRLLPDLTKLRCFSVVLPYSFEIFQDDWWDLNAMIADVGEKNKDLALVMLGGMNRDGRPPERRPWVYRSNAQMGKGEVLLDVERWDWKVKRALCHPTSTYTYVEETDSEV
jgi:hypothetical protein